MSDPTPAERGVSNRVVFSCDLGEAREASRSLCAFLAEQGLDESELANCELCLAEACNNAVQHAGEARRPIVAEAVCRESSVELSVTDNTRGFDLGDRRTTISPEGESGRGLFIIQSLMDEVHYFRGTKQNTLLMRKTRTHQQHRSADETKVATLEEARRQLENCQQTIGGMARELCFRSESLSAIFRCCAELGRTSEFDGFATRLLNDLLHLTSADWFVLRLLPAGQTRLVSTVVSSPELRADPLPVVRSTEAVLPAEVAAAITRRPVEYGGARPLSLSEPLRAAGPNANGLVQPLVFADQVVGTLAIGRREADAPLSVLQAEMVRTFSDFLALQIINARHLEEQVHARLVAHELDIAHRIQRALLPRSLPQFPTFNLSASWESARQVGGDFYDAIQVSEHSVLLVVADVMGKGVPAAMFATIFRSLLRAMAGRSCAPAELLHWLNELLYEELSSVGMFITAQLVFVDLEQRELVAASAGHCPTIIVSNDKSTTLRITGTPLGILPDVKYRQQATRLASTSAVVLYTDGLTESLNPAGEMFGHDRLENWVRLKFQPGRSAENLRDELVTELGQFRGDAPLRDDQAFLILAEESVPTKISTATAEPALAGAFA